MKKCNKTFYQQCQCIYVIIGNVAKGEECIWKKKCKCTNPKYNKEKDDKFN